MKRRDSTKNTFNPIINNPFEEPKRYYATTTEGTLDYDNIIEHRRPFVPDNPPIPINTQQKKIF
jgi:type III restriction enzyme